MKKILLFTILVLVMGCSVKKHPSTSEWSGSEIHAGGTILLPDSPIAINSGIQFSGIGPTTTPTLQQQVSPYFKMDSVRWTPSDFYAIDSEGMVIFNNPGYITEWSSDSKHFVVVGDSLSGDVAYKDNDKWFIIDTVATLNALIAVAESEGEQIHAWVMKNDSLKSLLARYKKPMRKKAHSRWHSQTIAKGTKTITKKSKDLWGWEKPFKFYVQPIQGAVTNTPTGRHKSQQQYSPNLILARSNPTGSYFTDSTTITKPDTTMIWFKEVVIWNRGWVLQPGKADSVIDTGRPEEIWRPGFLVNNHISFTIGYGDCSIDGIFLYIDKRRCLNKVLCYIERSESKNKNY